MMRAVYIMPAVMVVISTAAAIIYGYYGDWRRSLYWAAAAIITISVTL